MTDKPPLSVSIGTSFFLIELSNQKILYFLFNLVDLKLSQHSLETLIDIIKHVYKYIHGKYAVI